MDLTFLLALGVSAGFGWLMLNGHVGSKSTPRAGANRPSTSFAQMQQTALLYRPSHVALAKKLAYLDEISAEIDAILAQPTVETVDDTGVVAFKPDEPTTLEEFEGQQHIVRPMQMAIRALRPDQRVLAHKLMTGMPGLGKTLIAKVIANELRTRALSLGLEPVPFVETYAANLNSVAALDAQAQRLVGRGGIWFIDEIHVLNKELATKLYLLMEDGRYPFDGSATPTDMPDVMLIGATTDYGGLHAALKRRFGEPMMVRALARDELLSLARKLGHPIEDDAAELLVSRCWQSGAPFELKILFRECTIFAQAIGAASITRSVVEDVFTTYEIDEHGLRPIDRSVLAALFNRPRYRGKNQDFYCYGASESDVCSVAGLDKAEFQETIRPKLLSRGFIEVRAGVGLALTDRAISDYSQLRP